MRRWWIVIIMAISLQAVTVQKEWEVPYFGSIHDMMLADVDADGVDEIVGGAEGGIFAIEKDGRQLWHLHSTIGIRKLLRFNADDDPEPEFAGAGMLSVAIVDHNGSMLQRADLMMGMAFSRLPLAVVGSHVISYESGYYESGLVFTDSYQLFYKIDGAKPDMLTSADTDGDGTPDTLYVADESNHSIIGFDENGKELWRHNFDDNHAPFGVWAGKRGDGEALIIAATSGNTLVALDGAGKELWRYKQDKSVGDVWIFPEAIVVHTYNYSWFSETDNRFFLLDMDGTLLYESGLMGSTMGDVDIDAGKLAIACGYGVAIYGEDQTPLYRSNAYCEGEDANFKVNSILFDEDGHLFFSSLDIRETAENNGTTRVMSGGTLVLNIATGDIDGDGRDEIVAQGEVRTAVYDGEGSLLWLKDHLAVPEHKALYDFDGDGAKEIIGFYEGNLTVFDAKGKRAWSVPAYYSNIYPEIDVADYDGDGLPDIFCAGRNWDTQKYDVRVFRGTDGKLLHDFDDLSMVNWIKWIAKSDEKRLYYDNYFKVRWVGPEGNVSKGQWTDIVGAEKTRSLWKDLDGDGVQEYIAILRSDEEHYELAVYDVWSGSRIKSVIQALDGYEKEHNLLPTAVAVKGEGGTLRYYVTLASRLVAFDGSGTKVWEVPVTDKYGDPRFLGDVMTVGGYIIATGKEIYLFDKNGNEKQVLDTGPYMSGAEWSLPIALAYDGRGSVRLVVGGMGIFAYGGIDDDTQVSDTLRYQVGWNLVATPVDRAISLRDIEGLRIGWRYRNGTWFIHTMTDRQKEIAQERGYPSFDAIAPGDGVWIKTEKAGSIKVVGNKNTRPSLAGGWNLVGGIEATPESIRSKSPVVRVIWKYTEGRWQGRGFGIDPPEILQSLKKIEPNEGFWIYIEE